MSSPDKKSAFFYGDERDVIGAKLCIAVAADSDQRQTLYSGGGG